MIDLYQIRDARLLVVDDNQENIELLRAVLDQAGYTNVSATACPADVAALHARHNYDLILLDMQMPGLDGLDVIKALHRVEQDAYVPVIAITANPGYKIAALQAGARDFITKPLDLAEVTQRIHNLLEVRLLYRKVAEQGRLQRQMALHDHLTGLPNRRLLEDRIENALHHAARNRRMMAVFYMDLDGFKAINDTHGHDCGDNLLREVAQRLLDTCRQQDTLARIGGDEFILLLTDIGDMCDVMRPALKILEALAEPFQFGGNTLRVTASIGIATYPADGDDVDGLVNRADQALYDAKRAGRNRYHLAHVPGHADAGSSKQSDGGDAGGAPPHSSTHSQTVQHL